MFHYFYKYYVIILFLSLILCSCQRRESPQNTAPQDTSKIKSGADSSVNKINNRGFVLNKQIGLDKYKISLFSDTSKISKDKKSFWDIYLTIEDTTSHKITFNQGVFVALPEKDSVFNRVDLDNDGKQELIVIGSREMTSYTFQQGIIIDFKIKPEPILIVNDPTIIKTNNVYLIKTEVRGSPSVLVFGYNYCLRYSSGKLQWEYNENINSTNCMCRFDKNNEFIPVKNLDLMNIKKSLCSSEEALPCFEMYLLNKILLGDESGGWDYFNKIYKCKDKDEKRESLKEALKEDLKNIKESDYKFE
jgi:hypothetical protein